MLLFLLGLVVGISLTVGLLVYLGMRHAAEGPLNYTE